MHRYLAPQNFTRQTICVNCSFLMKKTKWQRKSSTIAAYLFVLSILCTAFFYGDSCTLCTVYTIGSLKDVDIVSLVRTQTDFFYTNARIHFKYTWYLISIASYIAIPFVDVCVCVCFDIKYMATQAYTNAYNMIVALTLCCDRISTHFAHTHTHSIPFAINTIDFNYMLRLLIVLIFFFSLSMVT